MGLQHYLQIFPSQLNTQFLLFITKIPCYYQILIFGGQEYNNWLKGTIGFSSMKSSKAEYT